MLSVVDISRRFGTRVALDSVTFDVRAGRMTGFVGRNGAGKSTAMRIILGVLEPDTGHVHLNGVPVNRGSRARFGYMPEERGLYPKMAVMEQLVYLGQLHGMSSRDARDSTRSLLKELGLLERARDKLESLSLGNQQRAQIAASLVDGPIALVLDEPFSGLDPSAVETGVEVLRRFSRQGIPVLLSSHQLDIVDRICDDLIVIGNGKILTSGEKEQVRAAHSRDEYVIEFRNRSELIPFSPPDGIKIIHRDQLSMNFTARDEETASRMLYVAAAEASGNIRRFSRVEPSLFEILQDVTKS